MTPTLSAVLIAKNESLTIARVVQQAAQFCDEVVVCDTGSTDDTVALAQAAGARVVHFAWVDDFAAARNYSFSQATGDWIVWLDADDVLPPDTIEVGKRLKTEVLGAIAANCIRCPYIYQYAEDGQPMLTQFRERIVRRSANLQWIGAVHEVLGELGISWSACTDFVVEHRTHPDNVARKSGRNLRIYDKTIDIKTASTRDLYLYAGELRVVQRYAEAIACYDRYFAEWPADKRDLFEEPYVARIDRIECYRKQGDLDTALRLACEAVYYNSTRAEAYALAALCHYDCQNWQAAFTLFLAAASCKAPTHGGVVYQSFYSKHIHDAIKECKQKLAAAQESAVSSSL